MASEDCVLSFRTSGPNYTRDPWVTGQQIGTQSLKKEFLKSSQKSAYEKVSIVRSAVIFAFYNDGEEGDWICYLPTPPHPCHPGSGTSRGNDRRFRLHCNSNLVGNLT